MTPHSRQRGIAAVEFALLLPLLLLLLFGLIDGGRALQANIIVVNLSREGANLAARGSTSLETGSQDIIYALMASAPPLDVKQRGMVYITRVMGTATGSVVLDQYRWNDTTRKLGFNASGYAPESKVYACKSWGTVTCGDIASKQRPASGIMNGQLDDGEVVYVVEAFYDFDMVTTGNLVPRFGPDLHSMTIF